MKNCKHKWLDEQLANIPKELWCIDISQRTLAGHTAPKRLICTICGKTKWEKEGQDEIQA